MAEAVNGQWMVRAGIERGGYTSVAIVIPRPNPTKASSADRIQITYTVGGNTYRKQNSMNFELKDRCF
jgi:hypothetical protein